MRKLLGESERVLDAFQGLVRIAQIPQGMGCKAPANHPGILCIEEGQGAMLLGVIEGNALLFVLLGEGKLPYEVKGRP
jgi:hypothetical protein